MLDNRIYFLAAEEHGPSTPIYDKYHIYFGNKNLKYLGATPSYPATNYSQITDYRLAQYQASTPLYNTELYNLDLSNLEQYMITVSATEQDQAKQKFVYFNQNTDWSLFKSDTLGAKVSGYFTGPHFKLYAYKQPNGGRIKLKIISSPESSFDPYTGESINATETVVVDNYYINLHSSTRVSELIYENNNLDDVRYYFIAEIVSQDNNSSSGSMVEFYNYKYLQKHSITFSNLEINDTLTFRGTGGILR